MRKDYVLLVSCADEDNGVIHFENYNRDNKVSLRNWVEKLLQIDNKSFIYEVEDDKWGNNDSFSVELLEFDEGEISERFEKFIRDEIQDYSYTEYVNFFVVRDYK